MRKIAFISIISMIISVSFLVWSEESKASSDIQNSYYDPKVHNIFIGKANKPTEKYGKGKLYVTFNIIKEYKDYMREKDTSNYAIPQRDDNPFIEGEEYLVCLKSTGPGWDADPGTGTKLLSEAKLEIEKLENILEHENKIIKLVEKNIYGQLAQHGAIIIVITKEMKEIMDKSSIFSRPVKVKEGEIVKFDPLHLSKIIHKNNDVYSVYVDSDEIRTAANHKNFLVPSRLIFEVKDFNGELKITNIKFNGYHLRQSDAGYSFEDDPSIIMIK
jgi:hypothetical protein